jgi:hypothetical protein
MSQLRKSVDTHVGAVHVAMARSKDTLTTRALHIEKKTLNFYLHNTVCSYVQMQRSSFVGGYLHFYVIGTCPKGR